MNHAVANITEFDLIDIIEWTTKRPDNTRILIYDLT